jgi:3-oxoacyl-[acyl-carrier protein] reductase
MNIGTANNKKIALVTGAAQGLGKAISLALVSRGIIVIAADINARALKAVEEELTTHEPESKSFGWDISNVRESKKQVKSLMSRFGHIDILVNNAGICPRTDFDKIDEEEWDRVLTVNLKSVFFLTQSVMYYMKENLYGRIVNISSAAGKTGGLQVGAHYSASKAAIICLTKTTALQGAKYGILCNAICPGVINTEMTTSISDQMSAVYLDRIPLGRIGTADDIAGAVTFLVSDTGDYITGEIIDVNGGFIMD